MTVPVALQLYSVREALAKDFVGVIKKVANIGYVGVEPHLQPSWDDDCRSQQALQGTGA